MSKLKDWVSVIGVVYIIVLLISNSEPSTNEIDETDYCEKARYWIGYWTHIQSNGQCYNTTQCQGW